MAGGDRVTDPSEPPSRRTWVAPLRARDSTESHRASTPLELLFDLCFVVAIAQAAASLHHAVADDHLGQALLGYPMVFFAIWWAWMNFTWFASAYDNDDVPYRLAVFVQIAGVLILAAGVPRAFDGRDFAVVTLGYCVMRLALVTMWVRAAGADPPRRRTDLRYATGVGVVQVGWILLLVAPAGVRVPGFLALVACELAVPIWAERTTPTRWHPHHIAERYALFTIIVLGESILAATLAVQSALDAGEALDDVALVAVGGLVIVCSMWWLYFTQPSSEIAVAARDGIDDESSNLPFTWGYGHYLVFASAAAVGAGLAVAVDRVSHQSEVSVRTAGLAVAAPVAIYLLSVWAVHRGAQRPARTFAYPVAAAVVVVAGAAGSGALVVGLVLVAVVAVTTSPNDGPSTG